MECVCVCVLQTLIEKKNPNPNTECLGRKKGKVNLHSFPQKNTLQTIRRGTVLRIVTSERWRTIRGNKYAEW